MPRSPDLPAGGEHSDGSSFGQQLRGGHGPTPQPGGPPGGPSIFTGVRVHPPQLGAAGARGVPEGGVHIEVPMERRFYVMNDLVSHPNLALAHFNTFFHRCKLEGMVFDLTDRVGTAFMLRGNFSGGAVGVVCVGRSPQDAFARQGEAMDFLQRLVGPDDPSRMHEDMGTFRAVHSTVHFIADRLTKAVGVQQAQHGNTGNSARTPA